MEPIVCKKCGAVDDFVTSQSGQHVRADCNQCGAYIKFLPQTREPICYIGKFYGKPFSLINDKDWLFWVLNNRPMNEKVRTQFQTRIDQLITA